MSPTPSTDPDASPKIFASAAAKVRLALASVAVLAVGLLAAPAVSPTSVAPPQEHAAPLLEEQVQQREAPQPFRGVNAIVGRVAAFNVSVHVPEARVTPVVDDFAESRGRSSREGFGVVVASTYILTHASTLRGQTSAEIATFDGQRLPATLAAYEPETGLALLVTAPLGGTPVSLAVTAPAPGTLAAAVGRWDGRDLAVPVFVSSVGTDRYTVSGTQGLVPAGMGVYSLEGELVAVTGEAPDAFPAREAAARLTARAAADDRRTSVGLTLQDLTGALVPLFGEAGALITTIVAGGPADAAGIEVGDVLVSVGGTMVDSSQTAARLLRTMVPGAAVPVRVRRAGRMREVEVTGALAFEVAALLRDAAGDARGVEARLLLPAATLDQAGVPPTARVITVNGRDVTTRAQLQRDLRTARFPVPVLVEFEGARFFAAIEKRP